MPVSDSRFRHYRKPGFVLALLLLFAVGAITVAGVLGLDRSKQWVEHTYQVIQQIEASAAELNRAEASARGYRLTGHQALQQEYLAATPLAKRRLADLVTATADNPTQQQRAIEFRDVASAHLAELQRLVDIQNERGRAAAQGATRIGAAVQRTLRIEALTGLMRDEEERLLRERSAASARDVRLLLAFVVTSLLVSLAMLWSLIWNLSRENRRSRLLEAEARDAVAKLEQTQALTHHLSEQRRALSIYAGMLQSCQNLDETMELTASTLQELIPHVGGRCYIARSSRDFFETAANFNQEAVASSDLLKPTECWGLRRGQPHHTNGGSGGMRCTHLDTGASLAGIATLCVPLVAHGDTLGLLHANAPSGGGPGDNDVYLITAIGEQLGMAIANLRLRETLRVQSLRDPLTGLFNRRYLEENLQRELLRCQRKGLPLSLLMLDIDHFKQFNDQHGHAAGDAVLAHVGHALHSLIRGEDLACRYGGEEFTIVLPEANARIALDRAEAIRAAISSTTILHLRNTLGPVTASIGIATFPQDGATPEVLFELADASLYRAKAEGRDRVVHAAA